MKTAEEWQDLFGKIERDALSIILAPSALATFKNPAISVRVMVDQLEHAKNARATKKSEDSYEIIFDAGLVAWLFELSETMIDDCELIFYSIERNADNTKNAARILFEIWMNFIIFHEWSHIICGHLNFSKTKSIWLEMAQSGKQSKLLDNEQVICLEAEADAFATKFLAMLHNFSWRILSQDIYGEFRANSITYDVVLAVALLFESFETLAVTGAHTHPTVTQRMAIFNIHFFDTMDKFKIDDFDFRTVVLKSNLDYFQFRRGMDAEAVKSMMIEHESFHTKVGQTLAALQLKEYRLSTLV